MNIIQKLKKSNLTGRGGASFPTHIKWEAVKKNKCDKKYVVCNASEGEPGILKDGYIFQTSPERVVDGMILAMEFLDAEKGFIYINEEYYKKFYRILTRLINNRNIEVFKKSHRAGYIGGEETALLNNLEKKRVEPRLKPPFPTVSGLWNYPTLINNVETFFDVSLINSGVYKNTRFYTINGDCLHNGVYEFSENITIIEVLKKTKNYPAFDFFVQIGGDGSGEVLNSSQLNQKIGGAGSVTVYSKRKYKPLDLVRGWVGFFKNESCGKCTPCREGTYRLLEILQKEQKDWNTFFDLLDNLDNSSFCALGRSVSVPIKSYNKNILNNNLKKL